MKTPLSRPFGRFGCSAPLHSDSPVEQARKAGPCGNGDWAGYSHVYANLAAAADKMGRDAGFRLSDSHVDTMADLGSGDENRMKYRQMWLRQYGWL
jgi:hypothetical protein